jgi:hypothetical protein
MAQRENIFITDSIRIKTTPEKIFGFLTGIVDDETYKRWHTDDHVSFQWLEGEPWAVGSIARAGEIMHGKVHTLKFVVTDVEQNKRIVYAPVSRLLRRFTPYNEFLIETDGDGCLFTATVTYRLGRIGKALLGKSIDKGMFGVKKHMKEEGENLKALLEGGK